MHAIKKSKLNKNLKLGHLEKEGEIDLTSPATEVMVNFHKTEPSVIDGNLNIVDAEKIMLIEHVHFKIVIDEFGEIIGGVSLLDLKGEKPILLAKNVGSRNQVTVKSIMVPLRKLPKVALEEIRVSTIEDIIHLLKVEHWGNIFVIDTNKKEICGFISAKDTAKRLGLKLDIDLSPVVHPIFSSTV